MPLELRLRIALARHRRVVVAALLALAVVAALQAVRPARPPTTQVVVAVRDLPTGHRITARDLEVRAWPAGTAPAGLVARPQGQVLAAPLRRGEPVTDVRVTPSGRSGPGDRLPPGSVAVTVRLTDPAASFLVTPGDRVQVIASVTTDPLAGSLPSGTGRTDQSTTDQSTTDQSTTDQSTTDPETIGPARVVVDDAVVLGAPRPATPDDDGSGGSTPGGGLLGALDGGATAESSGGQEDGGGALPAGVLVLAVPAADALDLAAVSGVRFVTVARQLSGLG